MQMLTSRKYLESCPRCSCLALDVLAVHHLELPVVEQQDLQHTRLLTAAAVEGGRCMLLAAAHAMHDAGRQGPSSNICAAMRCMLHVLTHKL